MILTDPVLHLGFLAVHPFGFCVAVALVVAYALTWWRATRSGLPIRYLPDLLIVVALGSLLAARLTFVALHPDLWRGGLTTFLALWQGGLSLIGGLIGGTLLLALYTWARREPFWRWADALTPPATVAVVIGLLGLPSSGEGWGQPTSGPFAMAVRVDLRPLSFVNETRFQPIFAYEVALFLGLMVLALLAEGWAARRHHVVRGVPALLGLLGAPVGYGVLRPLTLDADDPALVLRSQLLCALTAAVAAGLLLTRLWRVRRQGEITRELEQTWQQTQQRQAAFVQGKRPQPPIDSAQ